MRERTLEKWTPRLLLLKKKHQLLVSKRNYTCVWFTVPVYPRAHDTKRDAEVNGSPLRTSLSTVAALPVPRDGLHLLQSLTATVLLLSRSAVSAQTAH